MKRAILGLCLFLSACAPAVLDNPALLQSATQASGGGLALWQGNFKGVNASLRPDSSFGFEGNIVLNAMYRRTSGGARFALFLPQGSKVGQCERSGEGNGAIIKCSGAISEDRLQESFLAIDTAFLLAPAASDQYELRAEEGAEPELWRYKKSAGGGISVRQTPQGSLIKALKKSRGDASSPAQAGFEFTGVSGDAYKVRFTGSPISINVQITKYIPE